MNGMPVSSTPGVSRNKAKAVSELTRSEEKSQRVDVSLTIEKRNINDKLTLVGVINRYSAYDMTEGNGRREFTSMSAFKREVNSIIDGAQKELGR